MGSQTAGKLISHNMVYTCYITTEPDGAVRRQVR